MVTGGSAALSSQAAVGHLMVAALVRAAVGTQASVLRLRMAVCSVAQRAMTRTPVARGRHKRHHDQHVCSLFRACCGRALAISTVRRRPPQQKYPRYSRGTGLRPMAPQPATWGHAACVGVAMRGESSWVSSWSGWVDPSRPPGGLGLRGCSVASWQLAVSGGLGACKASLEPPLGA
jgi:hypothetical protein